MKIERFSWKEIKDVMKIESEAFSKDRWDEIEFMKYYESCPEGFLIARKGGVIGYIICERMQDSVGYIRSIAVKKEEKRSGVGRELIREAIKRLGLKKIYLHVRVSNKEAIEFYKSLGFRILQRFEDAYTDGEDAYYMELEAE